MLKYRLGYEHCDILYKFKYIIVYVVKYTS